MAARCESLPGGLEIVDLRRISSRELTPLLLEETVEWRRDLDWDFARSAELVGQFADSKALIGSALVDRGEVAGYGYAVLENHKGLIGDFYVRPGWRDGQNDVWLFRSVLDRLIGMDRLRRIESQLMLMPPRLGRDLQKTGDLQVYERLLMSLDCEAAEPVVVRPARRGFQLKAWGDHLQEAAASVISLAYKDHIDSRINDQYGTAAGARRFVANIVQFPGCGTFFRGGSLLAFNGGLALNGGTGWVAGVVLVSFVAPDVGHITQLCVTPQAQGCGLGYELLARGVVALRQGGAKRITLTVTDGNAAAIELYRRCGFREARRFSALVWNG